MERIYSAFFTSNNEPQPEELSKLAKSRDQNQNQTTHHGTPTTTAPKPYHEPVLPPALPPPRVLPPPSRPSGFDSSDLDPTFASAPRALPNDLLLDQLSPLATSTCASRVPVAFDLNGSSPQHQPDGISPSTRQLRETVQRRASLLRELKEAIKAALRAFAFAYGAKAFTAVLLASRKWSSMEYGYADAVRLLLRLDTIRFGAFIGSLVGSFRVAEIVTQYLRNKNDRLNHAIAGGISGLALLVDTPSRRGTVSLYIFVRMLDVLGRHLIADGVICDWKYSTEGLFAFSNAFIMYAFVMEPSLLPNSYYQWILKMGAVTHHGIGYAVRQPIRGVWDDTGARVRFRPCQPHYHMESCVTHAIKEWSHGLGRAIQIYLPVHFLPAVIFRLQKMLTSPLTSLAKISYAALCSSAFLTSYQMLVKFVICAVRNCCHQDYPIEAWFAGLVSGLSVFLEAPKRRSELMLYCFPRALEICWLMCKRRFRLRLGRHADVAFFCVSMALLMSRPSAHFKTTYLQILRFFFGSQSLI